MKTDKTVYAHTLRYHFCIGCGICKTVCPHNAIVYKIDKLGECKPVIKKDKCTHCGNCERFCPNTKEKFKSEAQAISKSKYPGDVGLENADYYVAWSPEYRDKAVSGGIVTAISVYLLDHKLIDGVVQVKAIFENKGKSHYKVVLSSTASEVSQNSGSAYQPVNYSEVLDILEPNKSYFIIGIPCVIRGLAKLFKEHRKFKKITPIFCSLVCSHNVSQLFNDYFLEMHKLPDNEKWKINFRNKDGALDASNFNSCIFTKGRVLYKENRFLSGWTRIWRNYWFSMEACNYCPDFWGAVADISVKDAWGKWENEKYGKSVAVVRSKLLKDIFCKCGLEFEPLTYEEMHVMQPQTNSYKQRHAFEKNFLSPWNTGNRKRGMLHNVLMARFSKRIYAYCGYRISSIVLPLLDRLFKLF